MAKAKDDDESLKRLGGGRWQTRDERFTIEPQSGTWVVVDGEQTDDLGLPLIRGPFGSLGAAKDAIGDGARRPGSRSSRCRRRRTARQPRPRRTGVSDPARPCRRRRPQAAGPATGAGDDARKPPRRSQRRPRSRSRRPSRAGSTELAPADRRRARDVDQAAHGGRRTRSRRDDPSRRRRATCRRSPPMPSPVGIDDLGPDAHAGGDRRRPGRRSRRRPGRSVAHRRR